MNNRLPTIALRDGLTLSDDSQLYDGDSYSPAIRLEGVDSDDKGIKLLLYGEALELLRTWLAALPQAPEYTARRVSEALADLHLWAMVAGKD